MSVSPVVAKICVSKDEANSMLKSASGSGGSAVSSASSSSPSCWVYVVFAFVQGAEVVGGFAERRMRQSLFVFLSYPRQLPFIQNSMSELSLSDAERHLHCEFGVPQSSTVASQLPPSMPTVIGCSAINRLPESIILAHQLQVPSSGLHSWQAVAVIVWSLLSTIKQHSYSSVAPHRAESLDFSNLVL